MKKTPSASTVVRKLSKIGRVYSSYLISPVVTFTEPEHVKHVLKLYESGVPKQQNTNISKNAMSDVLKMIGLQSIVAVNPPAWNHQRTVLNRAFTSPKVFFNVMKKKSELCIDIWKREGKPVKVGYSLQKMTLDVLACTIFGYDFDTLSGKGSEPLEAYNYCMEHIFNPLRLFLKSKNLPYFGAKKLAQNVDTFDNYCWKIMNEVKEKMGDKLVDVVDDEKDTSIIRLMIENGMDLQAVRDNISTFFIAGHETTAVALTYATGFLALYPDIQQKIRNEVNNVVPNELTFESLKNLHYLECFIKETMRYQPSINVMGGRETDRDIIIGDYFIPAKTNVQLDLCTMAHDPAIWGDPETFRPERFLNDQLTKEQRSAYIPFSAGPRFCIGMSFSLEEQKIFLTTLVKNFSSITMAPGATIVEAPKSFVNCPNLDLLSVNFK